MVFFVWEWGDENLVWVLVVGKLYNFMVRVIEDEVCFDVIDEFYVNVEWVWYK